MRTYEAAINRATSAAAGPIATLVEPSGGRRSSLLELGIFVGSAPASGPEVGIGLPGNTPAGTLTGTTVTANDPTDETGTGVLVTTFGTTQPTAPASFRRRILLPAVIGAGIVWTWERGEIAIPINAFNQGLVIWQITALVVTYDVYVKLSE